MRFSINTVLYVSPFTNQHTRLFRKFKQWGFDAVELLIEDPDHIDPVFLRRQLDRQGLACGSVAAGLGPDRDLRGSRASQRRGIKFLCALLDLMGPLGCPALVGPVYSFAGRAEAATMAERRTQWRTVVRNLKTVAAYADARGKIICVEPLNRFETDFLNTGEQGLQLIKDVNCPALKLHLDTFHTNIEEKHLDQAILQAGRHLGHLHVCGTDRGTPGKDHNDWRGMAAALRKINYTGDVVLETVTLDVPRIARSAAIWRRMEPTRDEIARDGLKFLRKTLT